MGLPRCRRLFRLCKRVETAVFWKLLCTKGRKGGCARLQQDGTLTGCRNVGVWNSMRTNSKAGVKDSTRCFYDVRGGSAAIASSSTTPQ